ncbi:inositol monophosphatase family protein [Lichenifustis flavocetrariae]|uniref:Inositol monophosphatase n=1 Tax=Lichenifustis flavocetrariae TaxID=2949735 RepID=A0AA41Z4R1_9HYPH|nr:inositol monophosphatase [Lichenifustis flavocetrariae]MCW6509237.1 inositol monophosphatase [Lichenifustis flavocetrariae]
MAADLDLDRCAEALRSLSDDLARTGPKTALDASPANLIRHAREVSAQASRSLRASLAELHPEIGWTSEEARPDGHDYWLFDPIDGAYHFLQGLPLWSSSLALVRHGRAVASIVYDPKGDELFAAIENSGTTCNGVPIAVSLKTDVSAAVVGTAIPPLAQVGEAEHAEALALLGAATRAVFVVRPMAAVSLQLAYVAAGRLDTYWENGRDAGDWLAGSLLVREAGGTVTHLDGATFGWSGEGIIAGNGGMYAALQQVLHGAAVDHRTGSTSHPGRS